MRIRDPLQSAIGVTNPVARIVASQMHAIERRRDRDPGALHVVAVHPRHQGGRIEQRFHADVVAVDRQHACLRLPGYAFDGIEVIREHRSEVSMHIQRDAFGHASAFAFATAGASLRVILR